MTKSNIDKLDQLGVKLTPPKGLTIKDVNYTKAIGCIFKSIIGAATANPNAMTNATAEFVSLVDYSDGEKAWHLVSKSTLIALEHMIKDGGMLTLQNVNLADKIEAVIENFSQQLLDLNCHLDKDFLTKPHKLLDEANCKAIITPTLTKLGHSDASANILYQRFVRYFPFALTHESQNSKIDYSSLFSAIKSEFADANKIALKKEQYKQFLIKQAYESVFDDSVGLKQIYVPLNAYYKEKPNNDNSVRTVIKLHDNLNEWIGNDNCDHDVKVISGGPGAGKSSFTKIWAAEIVDKLNYPVIYIPLQSFKIRDSLTSALTSYFADIPNWASLSQVLPNEEQLLIIFDGLDEYSMTGRQSDQAASEFVDEVIQTLQLKNSNGGGGKVKAIITGRNLAIDNNKSKWRHKGQILHLLPYYLSEQLRHQYHDENELLKKDLRQTWWQQYAAAKNLRLKYFPKAFNQDKLQEVSAEPLLNYLLTLSYLAKRIDFDDNTTLAAIYEDLILGVFNRDYSSSKKHKSTEEMASSDEFMLILEEVALAISYNGGRLATEQSIKEHIIDVDFSKLFEKLQQKAQSGVTRLLMAFYFRQGEVQDGDNTFEWTHKSFGEYLVARRLLRLLETIADERQRAIKKPGRGWQHHEALSKFVRTTARMELNESVGDFIKSILHQCTSDNLPNKTALTINELSQYQSFLADCINDRLEEHLEMNTHLPNEDFANLCKFECNTIICIFLLHSKIATITKQVSKLALRNNQSFRKLYLSMDSTTNKVIFRGALNYLNLDNQLLFALDLQIANFSHSSFNNSNFHSNLMRFTNFAHCNLTNSTISDMHLYHINFSASNLQNTDFVNLKLEYCNFGKSELESSNFEKIHGLETAQDLHLAKNIPEEWKQYIKDDVEDG